VGEVAVQLEDQVGLELERPPEPVEVRRTESFLPRPVQDVHPWALRCQPVGDLTSTVGRVVVDDEHDSVGAENLAQSLDHRLEVLALVVSWQTDANHA
jgi:hypothetical protein